MSTSNLIRHILPGGIRLLAGIATTSALTLVSMPTSATLVMPHGAKTIVRTGTGPDAKLLANVSSANITDPGQVLQAAYFDMASNVSLSLVSTIADNKCIFTGGGANSCSSNAITTVGKGNKGSQMENYKKEGVHGAIPREAQIVMNDTTPVAEGPDVLSKSALARVQPKHKAIDPAPVTAGAIAPQTARMVVAAGHRGPPMSLTGAHLSRSSETQMSSRVSKKPVRNNRGAGSTGSGNFTGTDRIDWGILSAGDKLSTNSTGMVNGSPSANNSDTLALNIAKNDSSYTPPHGVGDLSINIPTNVRNNGFTPPTAIPEPSTLFLIPLAFGVMLKSMRRLSVKI